jgi:hypothetical protein
MISGMFFKFQEYQFRLALTLALGLVFAVFVADAETNADPITGIKLNDYLQLVMEHNESVQAQMLEAEVARHKNKAEVGIFEPEFQAASRANPISARTMSSSRRRRMAKAISASATTFTILVCRTRFPPAAKSGWATR